MIKIYCTYDRVLEEYSIPWFAKNDNVACRNLKIAANRQNLPLTDVTLFCLGSFDQDNGIFDNINNPAISISLSDESNLIDDKPRE